MERIESARPARLSALMLRIRSSAALQMDNEDFLLASNAFVRQDTSFSPTAIAYLVSQRLHLAREALHWTVIHPCSHVEISWLSPDCK